MKKSLTLFGLSLLLTTGCQNSLISNEVKEDFKNRTETFKCDHAQKALELATDDETREALTFLYAYMSWPDVADYSPEFHVAQTQCALKAKREMAWGKNIPEREWLHFVLPTRVNNEHLDTFRTTCYEELKERVKGLSMAEAVLEVNHWCHEYVTYKPSDSRTSTPLQSMKTAYGRCGEESTFTVAALRAVGIPARQVYTPRWAHTDDNHAWVEAWVDGQWHFLGACEPEAVLDLGWFNQPASRAILMHTKAFGRYDGPEDVMSRTAAFTEINVTTNYADVSKTQVCVVNEAGEPVANAHLEFKVYNYAELYTVMKTQTDEQGKAAITAGLGDLVAWATDGQKYGFSKFTVGKDQEIKVVLNHKAGESFTTEMNITPPTGKNNLPEVDPAAAKENTRRFAIEDSIRTAYIATFPDSAKVKAFCEKEKADFDRFYGFVVKSRGNYQNVFDIYKKYGNLALDVLGTMSEKDIRDFEMKVLEDHLQYADAQATPHQLQYVWSPRITNEHLTPWRSYLKKAFTADEQQQFQSNPGNLVNWIKQHIATDSIWNPMHLCLSPESAHQYAFADVRSKGILFVAAARSLNIPARIDPVTAKVQYDAHAQQPEKGVAWTTVNFDEEKATPQTAQTGNVHLTYTPREYMENPRYYSHFTLSKLNGGMPALQEYGEGDSWATHFNKEVSMDAGDYVLTSGTRMANGSVLARFSVFSINKDQTTEVPLVMREDKGNVAVIGSFNAENKYYDVKDATVKSVLSTTGRGYFVVGLIKANHEPTNHILHDIEKLRKEMESWNRTILLLFTSQEELDRFNKNRSEFTNLPSNLRFGVDSEGQVAKDLFNSGLTHTKELPLVVIGDTFNRVVFKTQGYTIGLGEQIKQTIGKL